jgi:hypothetical protein
MKRKEKEKENKTDRNQLSYQFNKIEIQFIKSIQ